MFLDMLLAGMQSFRANTGVLSVRLYVSTRVWAAMSPSRRRQRNVWTHIHNKSINRLEKMVPGTNWGYEF